MNPDEIDLPSPQDLAEEVDAMPPKVPLRDYHDALNAMRGKGYSYAEVAEWISKKLGVEVSRNKVAYLLNTPAAVLQAEEAEEEMEDRADEAEEHR